MICSGCGVYIPLKIKKLVCSCGVITTKSQYVDKPLKLPQGPGTELLKIIPELFKSNACGCYAYARKMDEWGVSGCEERFDEIVEHLLTQAAKLPLLGTFPTVNRCFAKKWLRKAIDKS